MKSVVALLLLGAASSRGFDVGAPHPDEGALRAQAARRFASAWLIKPPEHGDTNALAWRLAPILILQAAPAAAADGRTNLPLPTVLCAEREVLIGSRPFRQVAYFWRPTTGDGHGLAARKPQGLLVTVDPEGWPVLHEVLDSPETARVFFATRRLEAAAAREFGAPLHGRLFAVERSLQSTRATIVARVIDDGPMPMGPMVYVGADLRTLTTVLCRCMPSQIESAAGSANYELQQSAWPEELTAGRRALDECLRLPGTLPTLADELDSLEPGGRRE